MAASWVLVCSDFVRHGGMDRANYELALFLANRARANRGGRIDVVGHRFEADLASHPNVVVHKVPRPLRVDMLGNVLLDSAGTRVARMRVGAEPRTRVLVNGGNCAWPDANWVHAVHRAWNVRDEGAPLVFRAKNRVAKWGFRAREAKALAAARVVIANSEKTRRELVTLLGLDERRIRVIYLGCDPEIDRPRPRAEVEALRKSLGVEPDELMVLFIGALGSDRNKGLDSLLDAWAELRKDGSDRRVGRLFVVGGGATPMWQRAIAARGLDREVQLLGFRRDVGDLLGAADLMVAPSRYDSYGLAIQEALCRHVPVIVSSRAGIAERYPGSLAMLVAPNPEDARDLAARIARWREERRHLAPHVAQLGDTLRTHDWKQMAAQIVTAIEAS
jgi:glycosyltransferase involved in cell wall biosynthesis